ncbi:MAG: hypothetical protein ACXVRX_14995, partial [Solirubrobacteraceae bacterium]
MLRGLRLSARIALIVGSGALLVGLGVTLLLVNTVKLKRSAEGAADVVLEHGDAVLVYTDGVSDPGPGAERFPAEALREHPHGADAEQLAAVLEDYARQP